MFEKMPHIKEDFYIGFLDRTINIHWNYHAILMVSIWLILVPICITIIRFGKPRPTEFGLRRQVHIKHPEWWWFSAHKYGLSLAVFLTLAGVAVALTVSRGFSGSVHSILGALTAILAVVQIVAGLLRGTHGGKYYNKANPDDPTTWQGDHYSRTTRRRIFEAYHKTAGYFTLFCAVGAIGSGLMQYPMPLLAKIVFILPFLYLAFWVVMEFFERRYDGYRAVHGYGAEHPYNKEREYL
ncbi:cytochrome b561 domain-containing protein [Rhodobacteraceae bacterium]|nr:cytochrome b561 domain-containing protein [Paracoccaceae bacterium]